MINFPEADVPLHFSPGVVAAAESVTAAAAAAPAGAQLLAVALL